ncbi:MAG: GNAT family N-acetyltransferase, partial [Planctomycetota bacterium]
MESELVLVNPTVLAILFCYERTQCEDFGCQGDTRFGQLAELDGRIVGCCSLEIIWADLAEIKSLAVDEALKGKGVGRLLVGAALEQAGELGVPKVFALTLEPQFFEKQGFTVVEKEALPM